MVFCSLLLLQFRDWFLLDYTDCRRLSKLVGPLVDFEGIESSGFFVSEDRNCNDGDIVAGSSAKMESSMSVEISTLKLLAIYRDNKKKSLQ
ncbi:hypothetical protein TorRG33x02_352040 [Trema orientale]|uniref:Uncharacterized protein n=1 Tax=Trema orientale TaxID=63057 RepID=A0A2P5AF25_TREOI|nr:hypothetical protein TorRG33x02_352040 [Trema orientale]